MACVCTIKPVGFVQFWQRFYLLEVLLIIALWHTAFIAGSHRLFSHDNFYSFIIKTNRIRSHVSFRVNKKNIYFSLRKQQFLMNKTRLLCAASENAKTTRMLWHHLWLQFVSRIPDETCLRLRSTQLLYYVEYNLFTERSYFGLSVTIWSFDFYDEKSI